MLLTVKTRSRTEMVDITADVGRMVAQSGVRVGLCMLYVPIPQPGSRSTRAPTQRTCDILMVLNEVVPWKAAYRHVEGNSPAHVKATTGGASQTVAIENSELVLGTWQGIFFCEFDGPRERTLHLRILEGRLK